MKIGKKVCCPRDRVRLTGTRRMLDKVFPTRTVCKDLCLQLSSRVELMVSREDDCRDLFLVVPFRHEIPTENLQPTVPFPNLLPQVRCAESARVQWIASTSIVTLVERQKFGVRAAQPSRHVNFTIADGEM